MREKIIELIEKHIAEEKSQEKSAGEADPASDFWRQFYYCHRTLEKIVFEIKQLPEEK